MMLDWAMTHDTDLADRVLASVATTAYPLGRWRELHRACDWMLADRPRGLHWAAAVGEISVAANWINRFDVFAITPEAMELASERQDRRTIRRLRVGPALAQVLAGDFTAARELRDDAVAENDDVVAFMAVTIMGTPLGVLGQRLRRCAASASTSPASSATARC